MKSSILALFVLASSGLFSVDAARKSDAAQYTFKCGSQVYMCGTMVTEESMCAIAGTKTVVRGTPKECATLLNVVKGSRAKSASVWTTKCPNNQLLSIYTRYNSAGKNGMKCSKANCVQCKGAHCGGDPHFLTYDGTGYTYHGQCDLVMARSANLHSTGMTLDVHARTSIKGDWSYISNVAMRIGDDILEVTSEDAHFFNGEEDVEFPIEMGGRYVATKVVKEIFPGQFRTDYTIDLMVHSDEHDSSDVIRVSSFKEMLSVTVDAMLHDTYGMLGISGKEGMLARDLDTVIEDPNQMGAMWQVNSTEPMLFHDIRAPQFPQACFLPKVDSRRRLRLETRENVRKAQEACAGVEDALQKFCVHDIVLTGDETYALTYLHRD